MRHLGRLTAAVAVLAAGLVWAGSALAAGDIVVSQVYGGGGNSGATFKNDFIELYNRGSTDVNVSGWSVQYASTAGTSWQRTNLSGTIRAGKYYLVQEAQGAGGTVNLPTPDAIGTIAMAAGAGKVALVLNQTTIASGTVCPSVVVLADLVGYGTGTNCFEGTGPTATLSNTTAAQRKLDGAQDTDDNAADFAVGAPNPRNSGDAAPTVASTTPASGAAGVARDASITVTFSEPVLVTDPWFSISCGASGAHTATAAGGPTTFTLDPDADFAGDERCTVTIDHSRVSDTDALDPPDTMDADYAWSFQTVAPPVEIAQIQGASHVSPKAGLAVAGVEGIVTALRTNGFYLQDPTPDADPATSDGIFVFTSSAPSVAVGDDVTVNGRVQEFRPGGAANGNLTTTELTSPSITVATHGNALPAATVVGTGGRVPPSQVIEDDASGSVETSGVFDPDTDGLDFWESLEGMRVQLNDAVAVGPSNSFGEIPVVGDDGANASIRTPRGGVLLRPDDGNPERVIADDSIVPLPAVDVGDHFSGPLVGVLDYNFGNFFLEVTQAITAVSGGLAREQTAAPGFHELSIATFNVENLDPGDGAAKFDRLAGLIVNNLRSPDLVTLEEVQDNNGPTNDSVTNADLTLNTLVSAIQAAGGPTYEYRYIDPVDDQDGGEPGGNIRIAFLFRTDRGLAFVDRAGGDSTTANQVVSTPTGPQLLYSPGLIDPTNAAWDSSRKPLAAEFTLLGDRFFVIGNHFNSKGGDDPLMGRFQPPTRSSEAQRHQQAQLVHDFVASILAADANANVVVLGDINDFEFSDTVQILEAGVLHDLIETLPQNERYSYEFEGNAQVLDHMLVSGHLLNSVPLEFDVVHVNAEFADQASDHDPSVVRLTLNHAPSADAGGPYAVAEGSSTALAASGADPDGDALSYAWDLDGDGVFESAGQTVSFTGADGPAVKTVTVRVTDGGTATTDTAEVTVANVAPTGTLAAPAQVFAGDPIGVSVTGVTDPSAVDTAAGFTYAFDCGAGYGSFSSASTASCVTTDTGVRTIRAKVQDKDGGVTELTASVSVVVTVESLCALVERVVRSDGIAQALCVKLRHGSYRAFANQVDAQTGKTISPSDAALLKRLAARLAEQAGGDREDDERRTRWQGWNDRNDGRRIGASTRQAGLGEGREP